MILPRPPRSEARPAADPVPPKPPLMAPTGSPTLDCIGDAVNSAFAPFQNAPPPEQGVAGQVSQYLGGALGLVGAPQQLIDNAFAGLTAPIAALFPAMPAITLAGMHIGMLHGHSHPPSLIPPSVVPIPLPSIGMVVGSCAMGVLGGGLPLARAGDIGISVTCGSFAPPFEIFTGSSNVFVGGARAARVLDITKHCNPSSMGPFDIAMGVAGVAAGAAGAIATGAAAAAAQAAADAAVLGIKLLCGKDPGLPPGVGALIGPPLPNVLIGGFPCPPIGDMIVGAFKKVLKALAKSAIKKLRPAKPANAKCADGSHPIYLVTGENYDTFTDFVSHGLFRWERRYTTAHAALDGPLGFGFRHLYQRQLDLRLHKATFIDWEGVEFEFPKFTPSQGVVRAHGYVLRRITTARYELSTHGQPVMVFAGDRFADVLPLVALRGDERELSFTYDDHRRLVAVDDRALSGPEQTSYALRYDPHGRIVALEELGKQPVGRFTCSYSPAGELAHVRDANNGVWAYAYDPAHRWTSQTDPRGYTYRFGYDEQGRCTFASGQDGLWEARAEYYPDKGVTHYVEGEGALWEYHYDHEGFVYKIVDSYGGERLRIRDPEGRILADIDPGGRKLTFLYDSDGANIGRMDRFGYIHPPESETMQLGDPFKRDLPSTALARTFAGAIQASPEAMFGATGRLLEIPAELRQLAHSVFRLRPFGAPPLAPETLSWCDSLGNLVYEVDGLKRVRRFSYDATNNEIARLDRDGRLYRQETLSWNLLGARIDPLGHAVRYTYDRIEQMVGLTDPLGNASRWAYDLCERLTQVWRHDRIRDIYEYDADDNFAVKLDGDRGLIFRNVEWSDNRFVTRRELASGGEHRYDYDARGRVTQASTDVHDVQMAYDFRGWRALDTRDGEGLRRTGGGTRDRVRLFERFEWACERTADGGTQLTAPNGAVSRLRHCSDGTVLRECSNGTREWLQYDHEGRLEARLTARPTPQGDQAGWAARYAYSAEGDLLSVADSARGTTSYELDEAHRLIGVTTSTGEHQRFEFDAANNLIHTESLSRLSLLPGNRPAATATEVFEHDARDRLALRRHRDGPLTRYRYDSFDMLDHVELHHGEHQTTWRAAYDAIGRRLWTEHDGQRRDFYWDGDRLAAELDPAGRLRIYLYAGHDALVPLAFVDYETRDAAPETGRIYHIFSDGAGMPLHIEDDRKEIVWWASRTDPWGKIVVHDSAQVEYNLRWPGHYFDQETGLHYNRYRYYDPALGRYLTQDPIGYQGSDVNLYAYCTNPLVHVDVLGLHNDDKPRTSADSESTDVNGQEHAQKPAKGSRAELMSHERADARVREATEQARLAYAADTNKSNNDVGPVVAGVIDRRTGEVFTAHNDRKGNPPENMHPVIADRVAELQKDGKRRHPSEPGSHAEAYALNDALNAREARGTPVTEADLGEFTVNPVWTRGKGRGNMAAGAEAAQCGNCTDITRGTRNLSGDAPPWLPPYD